MCLIGRLAQADAGTATSASSQDDDRAAQALVAFQAGRDLMSQKRYEEACGQFEESLKLDRGVGTMLNLGYCYEKLGKTASAWATYRDAAVAAQETGRLAWESAARQRITRLESTLLRVIIEVQPQAPGATLNVFVDGTALPKSVWGQPAPLYPGQHEVSANAANRRPWTVMFEVNAGHVPTVVVPPLDPVQAQLDTAKGQSQLRASARTRPGNTQRKIALVLGGAGLAALGAMAITGLVAISTYGSAGADCANGMCAAVGADAQSRGHTEANIATAAGVVGGVALAAAGVLWFTSPVRHKGVEIQAGIDVRNPGASLRGAW